jgi:flagellar motility protein MotE (MotC chaperone)
VRFRLIPVVIFAAALLLTVRMGGIYVEVGGSSVAEQAPGKPIDLTSGMNAARAAPEKPKSEPSRTDPAKPDAAKDGGAKPAARPEPAKTDAAKADPAKTDPAKGTAAADTSAGAKAAGEAKAEKPAETGSAKTAANTEGDKPADNTTAASDKSAGDAKATGKSVEATPQRPVLPRKPPRDEALPDPDDMSRGDLKILQELAQRRRELDQRERDLAMRDGLLKAAEKRVEEKIAELAAMKAKLEALVKQREEQQNAQVKSLVKIYENMKPKDAAQIFDQLDMGILVELMANMKEAKSAPIMAAMDPKRAKDVTARLLNRKALGPAADGERQKTAAR